MPDTAAIMPEVSVSGADPKSRPQPAAPAGEDALLAGIAGRAAAADRGEAGLAADLAALHADGMLDRLVEGAGRAPDAGETPAARADRVRAAVVALRRIGRASLPVGRIVEGHVNALKLIALYGAPPQRARARAAAAQGAIFGVWGAEAERPVTFRPHDEGGGLLSGEKCFASGLGLLHQAVLTAATADGAQLLLVDATAPERMDASGWRVSGMRATLSGRFRTDGLQAELLGAPGDYLREPHFEGGVWRYAALHTGGLEALAEAVRAHLRRRGLAEDPFQGARLAELATLAHGARLFVEDAAAAAEAPGAGEAAAARSLAARAAVEDACLRGIALADRALGTAGFAEGTPAERIRRDLGFFLRQANLDAKTMTVARAVAAAGAPVGEIW